MNKQGKGGLKKVAIFGLGTLAAVTMVVIIYFAVTEAGVGGVITGEAGTPAKTLAESIIETSKLGSIAQLDYLVYDWQASTKTGADVIPVFIVDKGSGVIIVDGTVSSATSNNVKTKIGANLAAYAFNKTISPGKSGSGYYAELNPYMVNGDEFNPLDFVISDEHAYIEIHTHAISGSLDVQIYNEHLKSGTNLTIQANSANSFDYLKVKNNGSNSAYRLAGIYIDTATYTNISDISIGENVVISTGQVSVLKDTGKSIERKQDADNYVFEFSVPIWLEPGDSIKTAPIKFTVDGDGCQAAAASAPVDYIDLIYTFDKACYKSAEATKIICPTKENNYDCCIEDDAASEADVGGVDIPLLYETTDSPGRSVCIS